MCLSYWYLALPSTTAHERACQQSRRFVRILWSVNFGLLVPGTSFLPAVCLSNHSCEYAIPKSTIARRKRNTSIVISTFVYQVPGIEAVSRTDAYLVPLIVRSHVPLPGTPEYRVLVISRPAACVVPGSCCFVITVPGDDWIPTYLVPLLPAPPWNGKIDTAERKDGAQLGVMFSGYR